MVFGSGFFKPNITSIISGMYKGNDKKKDGAYTIFYMGVNAGAFLGILLCGYIGEQVGWRWGFGLKKPLPKTNKVNPRYIKNGVSNAIAP